MVHGKLDYRIICKLEVTRLDVAIAIMFAACDRCHIRRHARCYARRRTRCHARRVRCDVRRCNVRRCNVRRCEVRRHIRSHVR